MSKQQKYASVAGVYQHHTIRAVLLEIAEDDKRWIPLSVVDCEELDLPSMSDGQALTLEIQTWWAEREGLI